MVKDLGGSNLVISAGVIDVNSDPTPSSDYALCATTGIYKTLKIPGQDPNDHKRLFMVVDGVGPLRDALDPKKLEADIKADDVLNSVFLRLMAVLTDHVLVSAGLCQTLLLTCLL